MRLLSEVRERLRALVFRAREEREMEAEMRFHLDMEAERLEREEGLPPEEARRRAAVAFGGEERFKEQVREARGMRWIEQLLQDVRHAVRGLRRSPTFTLVVVVTLALGIGATTAIFSVVYGVLLRPLPYPHADRIVTVGLGAQPSTHQRGWALSDRALQLFKTDRRAYQAFGASRGSQQEVLNGDPPEAIQVGLMTPGAFRVLGVPAEIGRLPAAGEGMETNVTKGSLVERPGAGLDGRLVLLSDAFWRSRYAANPAVVGRTIRLNGKPYVVIGVMPPGYDFPSPDDAAWIPILSDPASGNWSVGIYEGLARLRPGWTTAMAATDAKRVIGHFGEVGYTPVWLDHILTGSAIITPLKQTIVGKARVPLLILLGTVGFVLLTACSNVASLSLVRAEGRGRESAVRVALGAGRARLMRQQLTESVLLSLMGGAAGVLLAYLGTHLLVALAPSAVPRLGDIGIHREVLVFTTGVSIAAGILVGWLPAWRSSHHPSLTALGDGGRGHTTDKEGHRARNALVIAQVALALLLLVGAGLLARSFQRLTRVNPGFRPEHVLTFRLGHPERYRGADRVADFYERLAERLDAIPGVSSAGVVNGLPLTGGGGLMGLTIKEFPPAPGEPGTLFEIRLVTPGYFRTMGIPILAGRPFDRDDRGAAIIISQSVKRRYWPTTSALGKEIEALGWVVPDTARAHGEPREAAVVGVAGEVHNTGLGSAADEVLYYPLATDPFRILGSLNVVVRSATGPRAIIPEVRSVVRAIAPELPITHMRLMNEVVSHSLSRETFVMLLLSLAALIALILGAIGLYGVVSYAVSRRTAEIGIRVALGAAPVRVVAGVFSQGMRLACVGVAIGLLAAVGLGRVLASLLYGVGPLDPVTLAGCSLVFLAIAGVATLIPAGRAAHAAPADALRAE